MNIRAVAPSRGKGGMLSLPRSCSLWPRMAVMRIMFSATIKGMPKARTANLLRRLPRIMYAMNKANIRKPMKL